VTKDYYADRLLRWRPEYFLFTPMIRNLARTPTPYGNADCTAPFLRYLGRFVPRNALVAVLIQSM
jgi:hypothetical protein